MRKSGLVGFGWDQIVSSDGRLVGGQTNDGLGTYRVIVMIQREILLASVLPREPRGERGAF